MSDGRHPYYHLAINQFTMERLTKEWLRKDKSYFVVKHADHGCKKFPHGLHYHVIIREDEHEIDAVDYREWNIVPVRWLKEQLAYLKVPPRHFVKHNNMHDIHNLYESLPEGETDQYRRKKKKMTEVNDDGTIAWQHPTSRPMAKLILKNYMEKFIRPSWYSQGSIYARNQLTEAHPKEMDELENACIDLDFERQVDKTFESLKTKQLRTQRAIRKEGATWDDYLKFFDDVEVMTEARFQQLHEHYHLAPEDSQIILEILMGTNVNETKRACLLLHGPASSGKTLFAESLIQPFIIGRVATTTNERANDFRFMPYINVFAVFWDEMAWHSSHIEMMKTLLGGHGAPIQVKCKANQTVTDYTPTVAACNSIPYIGANYGYTDKQAFDTRCHRVDVVGVCQIEPRIKPYEIPMYLKVLKEKALQVEKRIYKDPDVDTDDEVMKDASVGVRTKKITKRARDKVKQQREEKIQEFMLMIEDEERGMDEELKTPREKLREKAIEWMGLPNLSSSNKRKDGTWWKAKHELKKREKEKRVKYF